MNRLNHSQARNIAESLWSRGGTISAKTTRKGAFYFSCASHGGFIIDGNVLTAQERTALKEYITPYKAVLYSWIRNGRKCQAISWEGRKKSFKYYTNQLELTETDIFVLEEDCAWSLAYILTSIRLREDLSQTRLNSRMEFASKCYKHYYQKKEIC